MRAATFGVLLVATGLVVSLAEPLPSQAQKGTVCWPLSFAGVTVGVTTDSQVQRLLGEGVFRPEEGHTGGRYFIDANKTATLHIVEGVDRVVEEVTLSQGVAAEIKANERSAAVSKWFDPEEQFGNWHVLHLGSTEKEVLSNLGEPQEKLSANKWLWETTCTCGSAYLTVAFKAGRLVEFSLVEEE